MSDERLATSLWVEAQLHALSLKGTTYYIVQKGEHSSGIVLLKLMDRGQNCRLLIQQRDFVSDVLGWVDALEAGGDQETVAESEADAYIQRAVARDPDLWVIEIEQDGLDNPFE